MVEAGVVEAGEVEQAGFDQRRARVARRFNAFGVACGGLLCAALCGACGGSTFRPQSKTQATALAKQLPGEAPIASREGTASAVVKILAVHDVQRRMRFELQLQPAGQRIGRAYLRGPFIKPCEDLSGTKAEIEYDARSQRWFVRVPPDIETRKLIDDAAFLDVWIEPLGQCARVPVSEYAAGYQHVSDPLLLVSGLRLDLVAPSTSDMVGLFHVPLGLGAWLGDVRAQLAVSLGGASCAEELCGLDRSGKEETLRWGWFFPVSAEVGTIATAGTESAFGLYMGARHAAGLGILPALSGERERRTIHMLTSVWGLALFDLQPAAFRAVATHSETFEISIPLGVAFSGLGQAADFGVLTGIELNGALAL